MKCEACMQTHKLSDSRYIHNVSPNDCLALYVSGNQNVFFFFCSPCLQLVANTVLFTSVNLSGLFVRILTERAQRKAFLQARNCIEERLRMEDENEKQVRGT